MKLQIDSGNPFYASPGEGCIVDKYTHKLIAGCSRSVIPDDVISIGEGAFSDSELKSIMIPASVKIIEKGAFDHCEELTAVRIGSGIRMIEKNAFNGCRKLETLMIEGDNESGLECIGEGAFSYCSALRLVILPGSLSEVADYAFRYTAGIEVLYYSGSEEQWNELEQIEEVRGAFFGAEKHFSYQSEDLPQLPEEIMPPPAEPASPEEPTDPVPPTGSETPGQGENQAPAPLMPDISDTGSSGGQDITKPSEDGKTPAPNEDGSGEQAANPPVAKKKGSKFTVTKGGVKMTYRVSADGKSPTVTLLKVDAKAKEVTIPDKVLDENRFSYRVTAIQKKAFYQNKKLKKLTIGKNVTSIGDRALEGCKALKKITIRSLNLKIGKKALKGLPKTAVVQIPKKKKKAYAKLLKKAGFAGKVTVK